MGGVEESLKEKLDVIEQYVSALDLCISVETKYLREIILVVVVAS